MIRSILEKWKNALLFAIALLIASIVYYQDHDDCNATTLRPIIESSISIENLWMKCMGGLFSGNYRSNLLFYNDTLIANDGLSQTISAIDIASGQPNWSISIYGALNLTFDQFRQRIYTHTIWAGSREMYAINPTSGEVIWNNNTYNNTRTNHAPILLPDGQLIINIYYDVRSVNVETGEYGVSISTIPLIGEVIDEGYVWKIEESYLKAVDIFTGETFWQASEKIPQNWCCLLWDVELNNNIILLRSNEQLLAYDRVTGKIRWAITEIAVTSNAILTDNYVYFLDLQATFYIIDTNTGLIKGFVRFKPPEPGHNGTSAESIIRSEIAIIKDHLAIYFADTNTLGVYDIKLP
jgi:outer membrane protein assembly factor BamB